MENNITCKPVSKKIKIWIIPISEYSLKTLINRELLDTGEIVDIIIKMVNGFTCYKILKLLLDKISKRIIYKCLLVGKIKVFVFPAVATKWRLKWNL